MKNKPQLADKNELEISPPPYRLKYLAAYFRIGLAIFLILSALVGLVGCGSATSKVSWEPASNFYKKATLNRLIAENTAPTAPVEELASKMRVYPIAKGFNLINFNSEKLCGALGCLYAIYARVNGQEPKRIWARYLNPNLPPGKILVELAEPPNGWPISERSPCLKFSQLEAGNIRETVECFDGTAYQIVQNRLVAYEK